MKYPINKSDLSKKLRQNLPSNQHKLDKEEKLTDEATTMIGKNNADTFVLHFFILV